MQPTATDDPDLAAFLRNRELLSSRREADRANELHALAEETPQDALRRLHDELPGDDRRLRGRLYLFEQAGKADAIRLLAQFYPQADAEALRASILALFRAERHIELLREYALSQLLADAQSPFPPLRAEALRVLAEIRDDDVRAFALRRLDDDPKDSHVLPALLANYRPGDGPRIVRLVKAVPLDVRSRVWHTVFSRVLTLIEHDADADRSCPPRCCPISRRRPSVRSAGNT